jgi:hypothetical protein
MQLPPGMEALGQGMGQPGMPGHNPAQPGAPGQKPALPGAGEQSGKPPVPLPKIPDLHLHAPTGQTTVLHTHYAEPPDKMQARTPGLLPAWARRIMAL